jgi:hypothetical protein
VKHLLSLLLLLGAVLGLLGQEVAFASAPGVRDEAVAASTMRDDCAEMMGIDQSQDNKPCEGLTLDCIAKMGCAIPPVIVSSALPLAVAAQMPDLPDLLPIRRLSGRVIGPEPDPPLLLG